MKDLKRDIEYYGTLIVTENERHEQVIKANKSEYCRNQKKKLKAAIENNLRGRGDRESVIEQIEDHIDRMSDQHLGLIKERIDGYYTECVNAQEKKLQESINKTSQQLEERYKVEEKEVNILNEIKKSLKEN